jgi:hypothetical protein
MRVAAREKYSRPTNNCRDSSVKRFAVGGGIVASKHQIIDIFGGLSMARKRQSWSEIKYY